MHATLGRHAGEYQIADAAIAQQVLDLGSVEAAAADLINDDIIRGWGKLGDDRVTRIPAGGESVRTREYSRLHRIRSAIPA